MPAVNKHLQFPLGRQPSGRLATKVALGATATMLVVSAAASATGAGSTVAGVSPQGLLGPAIEGNAPGVQGGAELADQRATSDEAASRSARRASKLKATRARTGKPLGNEVDRQKPKAQLAPTPAVSGGTPASNRALGMRMCADSGFSASQCADLGRLWERESGWSHKLANSSSGAFGIPQSLPGSKMASAGPDWRTNPATQIKWGLGYIKARYGNPSNAWAHSQSHGWY